jgi:carbamate kinase
MRVVAALGGNALLRRGEPPTLEAQRANVKIAARALAGIARAHEIVVAHGNGPQVGLLALQAEACKEVPGYSLDVLGAESEGMIGYLIEQALRRELPRSEIATLLTQVEVDVNDPELDHPSKPIGPVHATNDALRERGWAVVRDGDGWRRAVGSPRPRRIVEQVTIERLLDAGVLVVCAGGGGIPVARGPDGTLDGVEAVVDKDRTAALLARELGADLLLLLTDVPNLYRRWPSRLEPIEETNPVELGELQLEPGTMAPKVEAACEFVRATGARAGIGALADAEAILSGRAGTRIAAR